MKVVLLFLILNLFLGSCKNKELPAKYLSDITVLRVPENKPEETTPTDTTNPETPLQKQPEVSTSGKYHIIVGSFSTTEQQQAEKLVQKLQAENHPATLLPSAQRLRISIASFSTEVAATTALDQYKEITGRQDIWVYKAP